MSGGIFYLDEERDQRDRSPSPSPRGSPLLTGESQPPLPPTSNPNDPSSSSKSPSSSTTSAPSSLQIPTTGQPNIFSPQPQVINRKHQVPFAATPSFPSPLAQAITVPLHSDTSSSGSHSDTDDEHPQRRGSPPRSANGTPKRRDEALPRARTASPHTSQSNSPSSTHKSISRPPSPSRPQVLTPGALLMRSKRSSSGSLLAGSLPSVIPPVSKDSPPRTSSSKVSPTHPGSRRFSNVTRGDGSSSSPTSPISRRGSAGSNTSLGVPQASTYSGGSPLAFGSPELEPMRAGSTPRRRSSGSTQSPQRESREPKDVNVLGLGLVSSGVGVGGGNWETESSPGSSKGKGKTKDPSSGPPSPRVTRERTVAPMGVASPPRQRRPSEFLNPSSLDTRKMPVIGGPRTSIGNAHVTSLSTSASMISPLNPLPSPWAAESGSSPFSPPKSQPSEVSSSTSTSSMGGVIRLNRVPTSVKMATDLIKNNQPVPTSSSPPSAISSSSTPSVPTPNPSPAGSAPTPSHMPPPSKELANFNSLPTAGPHTGFPAPLDIGKGRPTLSVPTTPRYPSPIGGSPSLLSTASTSQEVHKQTSSSTLAPPSAFKAPLPPTQPRSRPSLPLDPNIQSDAFPSMHKTHRYRTSMHEATFKRPSDLSESPLLWPASSGIDSSAASNMPQSQKSVPYGLGLNLPTGAPRATSGNFGTGSGSLTPGAPSQPRVRSTTGKTLQMDLAGIGVMGDAASHASMIMQSRQAKLQRWRPNSAGKGSSEGLLPPGFSRSATTGAPAMLAAPRVDRQAQWGIKDKSPTAASSPGEDLPPFPSALNELERVGSLPARSPIAQAVERMPTQYHMHANAGPDRFASVMGPGGGAGMERQQSAGGSIGGVDWIDWYDCYKRYKEEKIRAEQIEATKPKVTQRGDSPRNGQGSGSASASASPVVEEGSLVGERSSQHRPSPKEIELASNFDESSAISLTPQTSRDEFASERQKRRRSLSIRSTLSAMDPTRSPNQRKASIFERPRQTSGSSVKSSAADSISSGVSGMKKKKNLVTKMEGWWNAVKSNFIPEAQHPQPYQPHRPSNLGAYPAQRVPSAPTSRRGSVLSPITTPQAALIAPAPVRRESSNSIRQATSHAELRHRPQHFEGQRLQEAASIVTSASADFSRLSLDTPREIFQPPMGQYMARHPSVVPEEPSRLPSRVASSLEARRKGGPNLRLELESNVLTQPRATPSSGSGSGNNHGLSSVPAHMKTGSSTTTSSSFNQPHSGPGLTPGVPRWDQTPSPIYPISVGTESRGDKEDRPVAPGAEITVASVRRHIRHRLNAAKEACDETLKKAIDAMTKFAEEQRTHQVLPQNLDDQPLDYFEAFSDSPLVDAEESEMEGGDMFDDGMRSRHASTSRPPSRRPSISRPANALGTSPTKRTAMLPSSPSRARRRPSAAPRTFPGQQRLSRNMSLNLDRTVSASSSRSTSRSHSPMPSSHRGLLAPAETEAVEGDKAFLVALQDLIVLATEVLDSSVSALVAKAGTCAEIIQKLQRVGQAWDEHDEWPGRDWYVDILMAVANLTRVLDWWEAEKGFWNFEHEDENEPIVFVMKPGGQKEEPRFDREFGAALTETRVSPLNALLQVPEPPASAVSLEVPSPDTTAGVLTAKQPVATPQATAVEDLRFLADHAKSVNIVMELSLQGEQIEYVNEAIMEVTGRDPEDCLNLPITDLLAPADSSVFAEASQKLLEDDNNTVQLRFRFEVHEMEDASHPPLEPGPVYIELEGVGMLMREKDAASHTMWVLKPVAATQVQVESISEAMFPRNGIISTEGILCRICEREIVTWFFEKHNETCDAVHRLEAEITGYNECLHDLHQTVAQLAEEIDDAVADELPPYQGVLFYTLPDSITSGHENTIPSTAQGVELKKVNKEDLQEVITVLLAAQQIEVPSVQEDEADLPFNVQRYLTPESEEKLGQIVRWQKPQTTDRALSLLFNHVENQMRRKQKAIARMQSTIRYSEKTRHEWEDKVNQVFAERDEGSQSDSGSDGPDVAQSPVEPITTPAEAVDTSPPGYRKIAPQARLPITQGHPQRPSTSHGESSSLFTIPASPFGQSGTPSMIQAAPSTAPLPAEPTFTPIALTPSPRPEPKRQDSKSPLLAPADAVGHHRRASSSRAFRDAPLSPRIPSAALHSRANAPSIKDFEIIKPISRGAFGSVYLAKKVATGDYFAIKALKKSDMIAKNQITNVKAERTILMNQASSPYVAKLFFSFQSKEYLYLVMEYLNGGDCATLVKTLGGLPEEWARNYTAEVVLGLEYLHARNIVHRDIKPDNLLIDARGHLKLTDFGLSRIGLLNRQVGGPRPAYLRGTNLRDTMQRRPNNRRHDSGSSDSPMISPELLPAPPMSNLGQSYFSQAHEITSADESSGSESAGIIPRHMRTMSMMTKVSNGGQTPPRFVGTPDYLAPESILGIGTDDRAVDWWALGVVLYEFIYGIPPFHADSPEKVFDNVVSRRINWHEDEMEISPEAHDLMDRLMCSDPLRRLGARGADEVKQHAFFAGIDWTTISTSEPSFIPEVTDPESTDYFDPRGATHTFHDDETVPQVLRQPDPLRLRPSAEESPRAAERMSAMMDDIANTDNFGEFNYKNVTSLKQANDDVIRKMRTDSMAPINQTLESAPSMHRRPRSLSVKLRDRARRKPSDSGQSHLGGPPSPSTSTSSAASTPSRASIPPSTPGAIPVLPQHFRRPSELNALDRVKSSEDSDIVRRASAPIRVRAGSGSSVSDRSTSMDLWRKRRQVSLNSETNSQGAIAPPLESPESQPGGGSVMGDRSLDVLIAEDNPISQKILETLLTRMGCRCICVEDGPQALAATMGSIRFDVIICDIHMPVVNGEQVARMIRSTNNHNQNTPIIACTSYEQHQSITEEGTLFSAVLAKPVSKVELIKCLGKLGFILSSAGSSAPSTSDAMSSATSA